ncbi:arginine deiminase-related protein [Vibrio tapetis]|uniref:Amidinotransferase n=1 Tax=Vibrio tapetis subsp. tapetis TaxID=1671868 RepID=A0A2N8ZK42_9VIBR|nr:arginine deiminase-related protein [Vibrio tapetis]SON52257.1 conserved protein of unknown function [Vibrio tapetis subsp. tapetis]
MLQSYSEMLNPIHEASTQHTANAVVMVPPKEFAFNAQTAQDNEFQHSLRLTPAKVREQALSEYGQMVDQLRREGVQVIELDYPVSSISTPDAVFPNNWFSTTPQGEIYTFPMACANRRHEVRVESLTQVLLESGRVVKDHHDLTQINDKDAFLESTGVMVKDHHNKTIYAALSARCDRSMLEEYAERLGYDRVISFQTQLPSGQPVYHTNVMMAVGESFCVICDEVIPEFERRFVLRSLAKDKQVISISYQQMLNFCGNILQLETVNGNKVIAMSSSAFNHFSKAQKKQLAGHGKLLPFDVNTIEQIGGGSVRCMLGEVFLPVRTPNL